MYHTFYGFNRLKTDFIIAIKLLKKSTNIVLIVQCMSIEVIHIDHE